MRETLKDKEFDEKKENKRGNLLQILEGYFFHDSSITWETNMKVVLWNLNYWKWKSKWEMC